MSLDAALVKAIAPELVAENNTRVTLFIGIARVNVSADVWGENYETAVALLTAHYLTMIGRGASGAAGPVTSEKVGDLQVSYGSIKGFMSEEQLNSTAYGQIYLQMRKTIPITPLVTD